MSFVDTTQRSGDSSEIESGECNMLIYRRTSILESSAQTLVNTVNCVGVMGKGIARSFKERDPAMFKAYKRICDKELLQPGKLWLWQGTENWVLNFPTKIHWRNPSRLEWIEAGLEKFVSVYEDFGITEVSFPRLGCGNGGLDWSDVQPLMERYLSSIRIPVFIHDFAVDIGLPEHFEEAARILRAEIPKEETFDSFVGLVRRALDLTGGDLVELCSNRRFNARMNDSILQIELPNASWTIEEEDLRGVWLALLNGLVTKEKAGWTMGGSGEALISLLSLLPQVRPVQIQRSKSPEPELALELRHHKKSDVVAPHSDSQYDLRWG